jgi:aspartate racemase
MMSDKCLGLIGGLGVGATTYYYERLFAAHEASGRRLNLVMAHAEVPSVFDYVRAGDRAGLAAYLAGFIRRLEAAGATFAAIPAITPHYCIRELVQISSLPVVDIIAPLYTEIRSRGIRRVALFGTRFVIESAIYGLVPDVEFILPKPEEIDIIHNTYVDLTKTCNGTAQQRETMTSLAHTIIRRDNVDAIVFAGTDLTSLFDEANTDFSYLDCAALHLKAITERLWADQGLAMPQSDPDSTITRRAGPR